MYWMYIKCTDRDRQILYLSPCAASFTVTIWQNLFTDIHLDYILAMNYAMLLNVT